MTVGGAHRTPPPTEKANPNRCCGGSPISAFHQFYRDLDSEFDRDDTSSNSTTGSSPAKSARSIRSPTPQSAEIYPRAGNFPGATVEFSTERHRGAVSPTPPTPELPFKKPVDGDTPPPLQAPASFETPQDWRQGRRRAKGPRDEAALSTSTPIPHRLDQEILPGNEPLAQHVLHA